MFSSENRVASSGVPTRSIIPPPFSSGMAELNSGASNVAVTNEDGVTTRQNTADVSVE